MSTHQVSKPRAAKKSIAEESARPGTCRSKVGCEAMEEPCANRMRPAGPAGSPACLFHRNSRTPPSLVVQCSVPVRRNRSFMPTTPVSAEASAGRSRGCEPRRPRSFGPYAVRIDHFRPFLDLGLHIGAEFVGLHRHRGGALLLPRLSHVRSRQDLVDLGVEELDD